MKRKCFLCLTLLLLVPSLAFAQTSRSKNIASTNQSWSSFIVAFRAAVNKRNRATLKGMIASPFLTQVDGEFNSPDKVLRWLDESKLWGELQDEVKAGAKFTNLGAGKRCAKEGIFCFSLGSDGRWRLSEQGENE